MSKTYSIIYRAIKRIPRGSVATYGQIARVAGFPNQARLIGYALHALREGTDETVPWWRVLNAKGESSLGSEDDSNLQRGLLEKEGVVFDPRGRVDLKKFGWKK
ncbi:MGMT family protein [bacterium]|nr:MGMT family protein [bacterium]MBU1983232.1 MGMT family protein [bacterium]